MQKVSKAILNEICLVLVAEVKGPEQVDLLVAWVGHIIFEEFVKSLALDDLSEIIGQGHDPLVLVLLPQDIHHVVEHIADLVHLHLVVCGI